jgi:hypothetical protein
MLNSAAKAKAIEVLPVPFRQGIYVDQQMSYTHTHTHTRARAHTHKFHWWMRKKDEEGRLFYLEKHLSEGSFSLPLMPHGPA